MRTDIYAYEEGDEFVVEWGGGRYSAGNPFGLDSQLTYAGLPAPRNLHLVGKVEAIERNQAAGEQAEGDDQ